MQYQISNSFAGPMQESLSQCSPTDSWRTWRPSGQEARTVRSAISLLPHAGVTEPVEDQDRQHRAGVGGEAARPAGREGHHGPPLLRPQGCHGALQGPAEHPPQAPLRQQVDGPVYHHALSPVSPAHSNVTFAKESRSNATHRHISSAYGQFSPAWPSSPLCLLACPSPAS